MNCTASNLGGLAYLVLVLGAAASVAAPSSGADGGQAGDLAALVGQPADIAPGAYLYRADRKPEENPPETAFLFAGAIGHKKEGVICGLLWEEPRPVSRVELVWPKEAKAIPRAEDIVLRWVPNGKRSSWWTRRGGAARAAAKAEVSSDGRTFAYAVDALDPASAVDNLVLALREGAPDPNGPHAVPTFRVFTPERWNQMDVEIEWGFQAGTETSDFSGRIEAYNGITAAPVPLAGDTGTTLVDDGAWQSKASGRSATTGRRGIALCLLYLGPTQNTRVWPHQARLEDVNRTILTVRTASGSFSFLPADLETGPILAPEYGFFIRAVGRRQAAPAAAANPQAPPPPNLLSKKVEAIAGSPAICGWGSNATPWFGANAADEPVTVQKVLTFAPRSVAMHPAPGRDVAVGWRSPIAGRASVSAKVADAHPSGGNGVEWRIVREGKSGREILAGGTIDRAGSQAIPSRADVKKLADVAVEAGDMLSLVVGARGNHACDSTSIELVITEVGGQGRTWDLAKDVAGSIHAGNPHGDSLGNAGVWCFHAPVSAARPAPTPQPVVLESRATSAREFVKELAARGLKTIRQRVREHEEQSWEGAMKALHGEREFPPYPKAEFEPAASIDVPERRLVDAWRVGAWHLLRVCKKDKDGHYIIEDHPYAHCGLETEVIIHTLDLMGMHRAARDGLARWKRQFGKPTGLFSDGEGCFKDAWSIAETPWSTQWALVEHFLLTGDKGWLSDWAPRLMKNAEWIVRQRRVFMKDVPGRKRLWCYGLLPPSNIWDSYHLRSWYAIDAGSCFALNRSAQVIGDIDPGAARKYLLEAEAYAQDILAAAEKSFVLSPVIRVCDGTYRSFLPPAPYIRGPASRSMPTDFGGDHTPGLYADAIRGGVHFINRSRLLGPDDPRAQGMIDVLEDRLLLEHHRLPMRTKGYDPEKDWFGGAGWYYQCGIERTPNVHLQWDDVPNFLRSFYNHYAVNIVVGPYTFNEHTTRGPADKSFEEAAFLERLRNLLVMEEGETLWLARATPRAWLEQGKKISVKNAPTWFGPVGYEIVSDVDNGKISATVEVPSREPPKAVLLRVRHPKAAPIKSVTVDGKDWTDFDKDREVVRLPGSGGTAKVVAHY